MACANILKESNQLPYVFEEKQNYGGLIYCSIEEGNIFHRVGGHVFNTKNNFVNEWFWNKFDKEKEFKKANRNSVIYLNKRFINYPIELNLNQLDSETGKKIVSELIDLSNNNSKKDAKSFQEFLNNNFGSTLCEIYFNKYNEKIWRRNLQSIPIYWLKGKLPMISPDEILFKNIYPLKEDNMVHSTFFYPVKGGSQFIVNRLSEGINFKRKLVKSICFEDKKIFLNEDIEGFDSLIFTGDVRTLSTILDKNIIQELNIDNLLREIKFLDSNATTTILCECDANPYSWVYLPEENIKPHRIIMTGNFSKNNNDENLDKNRITCTIECSGEVKLDEFLKDLNKIPFNPRFISYNFSKKSYIIQNDKTRLLINQLKNKLVRKNIFLCGRFAEWEYFNMDAAITSAMKVCNIAIK